MNEIKPEHVSDELMIQLHRMFGYFQPSIDAKADIVDVIDALIKHGFTVLMPGELYWCEVAVGKKWVAQSPWTCRTYDIGTHGVTYWYGACKFTTLEAAKAYCQQLENEARST